MKRLLDSNERALLISVKPRYVAQLIGGIKRVELRRTRPNITSGELVLIYESSPTMALVGYGIVEDVLSSSPQQLWPQVREWAGISKAEYIGYFEGAKNAYGIKFGTVNFLDEPIGLDVLREALEGFQPPQIYRYLSKEQVVNVLAS